LRVKNTINNYIGLNHNQKGAKPMKRQKLRKGIILILFLLFPIILYYFSPDLIVEGAFEGVATGSMVVFGLMFLFSLVLGRAICGWACPVGGLQEGLGMAQDKRARGGRRNWIKDFIWVPWLISIVIGAFAAGGLRKLDFAYRTDHGISVSDLHSLIVYMIVVSLITAMALIAGRRSFCHYLCWMAPFMVLGTKLKDKLGYPSLHLEAKPEKCSGCKQCTKRCPMSLEVADMVKKGDMQNTECILCGECADNCPGKAICFRYKHE
jgi:ferredoxin-type protein NapH